MEIAIIALHTEDAIPSAAVGRARGSETSESAVTIKHRPRPCSATASSKVLPIVTLDPLIPHLRVM